MQVLLKSLKKLRIQDWATSMIFTGLTSHYLVFQQPFFNCKSTLKIIDSKTYQSINVVACSFINEQCDTQFESVYTLYGKCLRFRPKWVVTWYIGVLLHSLYDMLHIEVIFSDKENMVAPFGRQATLTMIISYNDSDWTTGWNHLLKGATMFLTPSYEQEWGAPILLS